jgi:hypothetical protein
MCGKNSIENMIEGMGDCLKDPEYLESFAKDSSEKKEKSFTGEILKFKHHKTGENISYNLVEGEEICEAVCPVDQTNLIYFVVSQAGAGYHCCNCDAIYKSI